MAAPALTICFDRPDKTYLGGENVTGQVKVVVADRIEDAELVLDFRCRASSKAQNIRRTIDREQREIKLFAGEWLPGQYVYPFAIDLPPGPRTYRGRIFDVAWQLEAAVRSSREDAAIASEITLLAEQKTLFDGETGGPVKLEHRETAKNLTGCFSVAVFFTAIGIYLVWKSFPAEPEAAELYGMGGLLITLVGGAALFLLTYSALIYRRIKKSEVRLGARSAAPGETIPFTLTFEGNIPFDIDKAVVVLRANEIIDFFRSSSNKKYLKEGLYENRRELPLAVKRVRTHVPLQIQGEVVIPPEAPCSIDMMQSGKGMALAWEIEFTLEMKKWPDWVHFEDIVVRP
jgi:hypothetical protein